MLHSGFKFIDTMLKAREAGKVRFLGFAVDNDSAKRAFDCGAFDTLQTSFNIADRRARKGLLVSARSPTASGRGVSTSWRTSPTPPEIAKQVRDVIREERRIR